MTEYMIQASQLSKQYAGGYQAIKDISFNCKKGEIVGFLGPNGAGKTTTMRILTGYMPPSSGTAKIAGFDTLQNSLQARQHLGYLPETVPLYPEMSVEKYLEFIGKVRRLDNIWDRVDDVLDSVGLLSRAESLISTLSKGMRQRVGLAQALLHNPDVLILDEPTIGLDPSQIREVRDLITSLREKHTILLSTHILSEVEQICNRVIMIINGRVYADIPINQTETSDTAATVALTVGQADENTVSTLSGLPNVLNVTADGINQYKLTITDSEYTRQMIAAAAVRSWGLVELTSARNSLETLFMDKLREAELENELSGTEEEE
jgi:ABC-2 type transport system ATP-binding protein